MEYTFIIAVIPVILVVAFLVWIAKKITDGERLDMKEGVLGVVILMVAVLIMVPMVSSTQVYTWDEDTGELVIQQNISGGSYAWDSYDDQIRSIVIKPGVTQIGNSAFDGATNVRYISIPDTVTDIGTNAFSVTLKDYRDQTLTDFETGEYAGAGDGILYLVDDSIYNYSTDKATITGIKSSAASTAKNLAFPSVYDGVEVTAIGSSAFTSNSVILVAVADPNGNLSSIGANAFRNCASITKVSFGDSLATIGESAFRATGALTSISLPESVTSLGADAFYGSRMVTVGSLGSITALGNTTFSNCGYLESISLPSTLTSIGDSAFFACTSLTEISIPEGTASIGAAAFQGCTSLASVSLPSTLTSIGDSAFRQCSGITSLDLPGGLATIGESAFRLCSGITALSFGSGFSPSLGTDWAFSWTFYGTDGTTTIDKTVAANLAGKTFQGTASALIEVEPGRLALTPQQIQQVHLHDTELQDLKDQISLEPLPLQPSLQEQELTA